MKEKLTNKKIIEYANELNEIQTKEKEYFGKTGKKLLQGKIRISYAISKNLEEFKTQLKAYNEIFSKIVDEYRDTEEERKVLKDEMELAKKESRRPRELEVIIRDGKNKEEYIEKIKELQEIETEVDIYTVPFDLLEGLELDSSDISRLIFMLEE